MKKKILALLLVVSLLFTFVTPLLAAGNGSGFSTDANNDGIPDALYEASSRVEAAAPMGNAAMAQALDRFYKSLPYSPKVRLLQRRAASLILELRDASPERRTGIRMELNAIEKEMEADPSYAEVMKGMDAIVAHETGLPVGSTRIGADGVNWSSLHRGHVMLVRSGLVPWTALIYAMWYSHAGTYHGYSLVYESNTDGVRLKPLSNWKHSNYYVGLGYDNRRTSSQVENALSWAEGFYGTDGRTPYNYWYPDKETDSKLYCSQLVWKIHKHIGVDLDSNSWIYLAWLTARWGPIGYVVGLLAVAPDEIGLSSYVTFYSKGWNH